MQKSLFALLACAILLFGCAATVPQSKYDSLAQECEAQKTTAAGLLDDMTAKANGYKTSAADCANSRQATEKLISDQAGQIAAMKADSATLAAARQKTGLIADYKLALAYFNDSYGPGNIPTTPKLKRLEAVILQLNDQSLRAAWLDFSKCTYMAECQAAKDRFAASANASINLLTYQAAGIIAKQN